MTQALPRSSFGAAGSAGLIHRPAKERFRSRHGWLESWHPHRPMEIISVIVEGELTHRDSLGHAQTLTAGEVQVLSAGSGIIHSEMNEADRSCRFLQIWIEPASRDVAPGYDQRCFGIGPGWTALIDPEPSGAALSIHRPVRLWRTRPAPGSPLTLPLAPGADRAGPIPHLEKGDGLGFHPGVIRSITAVDTDADLLLFELG